MAEHTQIHRRRTPPALVFPTEAGKPPPDVTEVAPGVLWIQMPVPFSVKAVNLWALREGQGWAVVDTGVCNAETERAWQQLLAPQGPLGGAALTRVLVSHLHPDHIGMAGWLTQRFDCPLWMCTEEYLAARLHQAEATQPVSQGNLDFLRRAGWSADDIEAHRSTFADHGALIHPVPSAHVRLQDGQRLVIGGHEWQVFVAAGHTLAHATFHCAALKLYITGDQILPRISPNVSVTALEPQADSLGRWLASLRQIRREVPNDVLVLPSHNEPFHGLHAQIDHLLTGHAQSLERLWLSLARPQRVVDTFAALFARPVGPNAHTRLLATGESLAHLNHLLLHQHATRDIDADGVAWYRQTPRRPRDFHDIQDGTP